MPTTGTLSKFVFIAKLLNNLVISCSLINLDILLSHNEQFDKILVLL